ncbi:MAG: cytochrome c family protein [Desulfobacterales bacterium]|nr:cytochrome c family protein [Desulfobacterales bacterium]
MMIIKWLVFLSNRCDQNAAMPEHWRREGTLADVLPIKKFLSVTVVSICLTGVSFPAYAQQAIDNGYVGSTSCQPCHKAQYENFQTYARKSKSFDSVRKMSNGLTPDEIKNCYTCHCTGFGKAGGFISEDKTPELKDAGCEVCHGPGQRHIKTRNPDHILKEVTIQICQECHTEDRVTSFRYTPVIHAGCH